MDDDVVRIVLNIFIGMFVDLYKILLCTRILPNLPGERKNCMKTQDSFYEFVFKHKNKQYLIVNTSYFIMNTSAFVFLLILGLAAAGI